MGLYFRGHSALIYEDRKKNLFLIAFYFFYYFIYFSLATCFAMDVSCRELLLLVDSAQALMLD